MHIAQLPIYLLKGRQPFRADGSFHGQVVTFVYYGNGTDDWRDGAASGVSQSQAAAERVDNLHFCDQGQIVRDIKRRRSFFAERLKPYVAHLQSARPQQTVGHPPAQARIEKSAVLTKEVNSRSLTSTRICKVQVRVIQDEIAVGFVVSLQSY